MDEQETVCIPQPEEAAQPQAAPVAETVTVVDVRFRNNAKTYFFDPGELVIAAGSHVIIDTARGDEFGLCTAGNHTVSGAEIVPPLRRVLRIATRTDERVNEENLEKEKRAYEVCQQKILEHKLDMQLVSAECAFDGSKILFFFTADGRVDFRELVKDLASVFRTRIELRQIGVRDKAKMLGGLGICGRPFCCKEFLDDFQPVSIKMAKTQNLSLNPTKISGTCGRLMCCLKYEQEAYEDLIKTAPKNESFVDTPDGRGTITEVNLLRQCVKVRMEDDPDTVGCYKNCDICVLRSGKARKNDPPIPKDVAPISSQPRQQRKLVEPEDLMPEVIYPDQVAVIEEAEEPLPQAEPKTADAALDSAAEEKKNPQRRRRRSRGHSGKSTEASDAAPAPAQQPKQSPPAESKAQQPKQNGASQKPENGDPNRSSNHHHRRRSHGSKPANPSGQEG